jgi:3alpha(or 20beta)-hydroxysteroid dehydrogenase
MPADVRGRNVIVTGAAGGMGAAHCEALVSGGATVVIADIRDDEGAALARQLGSRARFVHLDVSQATDWAIAVQAGEQAFGPFTGLVNNAGIGHVIAFDDVTEAEYRRYIEINQMGVFLGMKAVLPSMRRRTGGDASIVNISSAAGLVAGHDVFPYVATKFAVTGMTKAAATDLGPLGIRVNSVHPGVIGGTGMTKGAEDYSKPVVERTPLRRLGKVHDVSSLVLYLISDESGFCTGSSFVIDGGLICHY